LTRRFINRWVTITLWIFQVLYLLILLTAGVSFSFEENDWIRGARKMHWQIVSCHKHVVVSIKVEMRQIQREWRLRYQFDGNAGLFFRNLL
jgi:hypothetical protein